MCRNTAVVVLLFVQVSLQKTDAADDCFCTAVWKPVWWVAQPDSCARCLLRSLQWWANYPLFNDFHVASMSSLLTPHLPCLATQSQPRIIALNTWTAPPSSLCSDKNGKQYSNICKAKCDNANLDSFSECGGIREPKVWTWCILVPASFLR